MVYVAGDDVTRQFDESGVFADRGLTVWKEMDSPGVGVAFDSGRFHFHF